MEMCAVAGFYAKKLPLIRSYSQAKALFSKIV
jgi:hypothetical protein